MGVAPGDGRVETDATGEHVRRAGRLAVSRPNDEPARADRNANLGWDRLRVACAERKHAGEASVEELVVPDHVLCGPWGRGRVGCAGLVPEHGHACGSDALID